MSNIRGKSGANKSTYMTNDKCGECMVCHKIFPINQLVVAHYVGMGRVQDDHGDVCPTCDIPEHWYGCGCGG